MQSLPVDCAVVIFSLLPPQYLRTVRYVSKWAAAAADIVAESASYTWTVLQFGSLMHYGHHVAVVSHISQKYKCAYFAINGDYVVYIRCPSIWLPALQKYDRGTIRAMLSRVKPVLKN